VATLTLPVAKYVFTHGILVQNARELSNARRSQTYISSFAQRMCTYSGNQSTTELNVKSTITKCITGLPSVWGRRPRPVH
jgi:hypothetical protein